MSANDVIRFDCDHCGKTLKVPADKAGKQGKCPGCQKPILVPEPEIELDLPAEENSWIDDLPPAQANAPAVATPTRSANPQGKPAWLRAMFCDEWAGAMLCGVAIIWLLVLLRVFGLDLLHLLDRKSTASPLSLIGYFFIALGLSAVALPIGLLRFRRAFDILSRGVEVPGWIEKEGIAFVNSSGASGRKVVVGYEFEGNHYNIAITDRLFKQFEQKLGAKPTTFVVIVDPENPKSALVDERVCEKT